MGFTLANTLDERYCWAGTVAGPTFCREKCELNPAATRNLSLSDYMTAGDCRPDVFKQ